MLYFIRLNQFPSEEPMGIHEYEVSSIMLIFPFESQLFVMPST